MIVASQRGPRTTSAFVAVTHDPKIDDPALLHAFERDCFYIGALGSRKTHAKRGDRLKSQGATDADIAKTTGYTLADVQSCSETGSSGGRETANNYQDQPRLPAIPVTIPAGALGGVR